MKTVLIPASNSFFVRNFLRNGFARALSAAGLRAIFLVPAEKIEYYKKEFGGQGIECGALPLDTPSVADRFFKKLEGWSIHSRFVALAHWYFLVRPHPKDSLVRRCVVFPVRMALWSVGRFRAWRALVRFLFSLVSHPSIRALVRDYAPDAVFCPSMNLGDEWHFLNEAKKLGIKTIGMTPSWDTFFSKTFLRVQPDVLLVQTNVMREQASARADYPREKIWVTGVPQYDRYFLRKDILPREDFLKSIGADPHKKLIVYACSGKVTLDLDTQMLPLLNRLLTRIGYADRAEVLVRTHPKRMLPSAVLEHARSQFGFLAEKPATALAVSRDKWEFDERAITLLTNTLAHADVVISACTTFFVEAAIFDTPLIAISFDPGKQKIYWNSARRFFAWEHLADAARTGGIVRARSEDDLARALGTYLSDPTLHAEGRKKMIEEQAVFTDGQSLRRIVAALGAVV